MEIYNYNSSHIHKFRVYYQYSIELFSSVDVVRTLEKLCDVYHCFAVYIKNHGPSTAFTPLH